MEAYFGLFAAIFYSFFILIGNDGYTDYSFILYVLWGFALANFLFVKIFNKIDKDDRERKEILEEKQKTKIRISRLEDKIESLEKKTKRKKIAKKKTIKKDDKNTSI